MTKQMVKGYGCQTKEAGPSTGQRWLGLDVVFRESVLYKWHNRLCECLNPGDTCEPPTGSRCPLESRESEPPASPIILTEFPSWKPSVTDRLLELGQSEAIQQEGVTPGISITLRFCIGKEEARLWTPVNSPRKTPLGKTLGRQPASFFGTFTSLSYRWGDQVTAMPIREITQHT